MNTALVLDPAVIKQLRRECVGAEFPAGATVCSPGDPPQFYVVLSGEITLRLVGSDGLSYEERRAGAGATFGETSILGSGREPAEAVASCPSTLLAFTPAWFWGAMEELPALRAHVLHSLANESRSARLAAWELYRKGQVGQRIAKSSSQSGPLVARSGAMKEVQKELAELFRQFVPVLITGERGTGKTFVATKLFESSFDDESPFVVIDCRSLEGGSAPSILFGDRQFQRAPDPSSGYGAVHVAHRGALLLRHVDCLPSSCQPALADYLNACGDSGEDFFPRTRVLATSRQNLLALAEDGRFDSRLAGVLLRNSLKLPNMENRRRDIPDLITQFLRERNDGSSLGKDAAAFLYSRDYPAYHAGELKGIVNFAAVMARGEPIRAQHVVGDRRPHTVDYDPSRGSSLVRWMTLGAGLRVLRAICATGFATVILAALLAPDTVIRQTANSSIWALWEPALILSFLFLGRLWCAVCPLAMPGLALQRRLGLHLKVPAFVKEYGPYMAASGIVLICLFGHAFEMKANPGPTCVLLLTLVGLATLCSVVFERHAWCQHLCPMGAFAGSFANLSSLVVWANPWYCVNRCTSPHCVNGREGREGCPTFRRPNQISSQSQCKFCMSCLKLCPDQSVSLQLSAPLTRLWHSAGLDNRLTPPLLSLYALSLFMLGSDLFPSMRTGAGLVMTVACSLALGGGLTWSLNRAFRHEAGSDSSFLARVAGALAALAWGTLVADQLQHLSWLEAVRIFIAPNARSGGILPSLNLPGFSAVPVLQIAVLLLGAALCVYALRKVSARLKSLGGKMETPNWVALHVLVVFHLGTSVALVLRRF